jgi:transcription elongation factor GreB
MGRYRSPPEKSSPYITRGGATSLREELQFLWRKKRPEVLSALAAAAAEGDRSENAEYIYRKKQIAEIDRRVRYLTKRMDVLRIVDQLPADRETVYFSAWVELKDASGASYSYRIVGADEFHFAEAWISVDSPMAKALLGRKLGDSIKVVRPEDTAVFEITAIRYQDPGSE